MSDLEHHRVVVDRALDGLGLGWDGWPDVAVNAMLADSERLSALIVLLATPEPEAQGSPMRAVSYDPNDDTLDWLGRMRHPWNRVARLRYPWSRDTATVAVLAVSRRGVYDDRRVAAALRGAAVVCAAGEADAALLDALGECRLWLDDLPPEESRVLQMRNLVRRIVASATPPQLLDLSLLVAGDRWAGRARGCAEQLPADDIAPLVRKLGELGPRKPSQAWLRATEQALAPRAARHLLASWVALATDTEVVPEVPRQIIGHVPGTLFMPANQDIVRATVLATRFLRDVPGIAEHLGVLARRGSAHNGMPGIPEALALKVAFAAVDSLIVRSTAADITVLKLLRRQVSRRDLTRRVHAALDNES